MDGGEPERWSAVARTWSDTWGDLPRPLWDIVLRQTEVGPGSRVLDAGCGSGEVLAHLAAAGAEVAGFDPAQGMVSVARERVPTADIRTADLSAVPWPGASFDLVVSVNAVQFAADPVAAVRELIRVCRTGGWVALAGWAEDDRNDLARLEAAAAAATARHLPPDGPLRHAGGLTALLSAAGARPVVEGEVELPWSAADDEELLRGVLLGEDAVTRTRAREPVLSTAADFRRGRGFSLTTTFRYAFARPA